MQEGPKSNFTTLQESQKEISIVHIKSGFGYTISGLIHMVDLVLKYIQLEKEVIPMHIIIFGGLFISLWPLLDLKDSQIYPIYKGPMFRLAVLALRY